MKVTFIIRDVTDQFFTGFGEQIIGLLNMVDMDKFNHLNKNRSRFPMKIGSGQFRDAVDLNSLLKKNPYVEFSLEPRRGYKLATFKFS